MEILNKKEQEYWIKFLVHECVRNNTILEDLHCQGKITDEEMKIFMKGICNNVSAFIKIWNGYNDNPILPLPKNAVDNFNWDKPNYKKSRFCVNPFYFLPLISREEN